MLASTKKLLGLSIVIFFGTISCQIPDYEEPVPALLPNGTPDDQMKIRIILEKALNRDDIILSKNPFSEKSYLVVEKSFRRSLKGDNTSGFIVSSPEKFSLLKDGKGCLISHVNSNRIWRLQNVVCNRQPLLVIEKSKAYFN
jgi:hypothetical protein